MKDWLLKLGKMNAVLIITAIAVALAMLLDVSVGYLLNHDMNISQGLVRAGVLAVLIAPLISWNLLDVFFEVDLLEKEMSKLASYDDLTGLYNRRAFYQSCENLHTYSMRIEQSYCLLVIDLDHFKEINDQFGHIAGDLVLTAFSDLSTGVSRESDILGRVGGDEFAFLLPDTDIEQAKDFSKRLHNKIVDTVVREGRSEISFSVSIGISLNDCRGTLTVDDVFKRSDKALYKAKRNGRNQVAIYE